MTGKRTLLQTCALACVAGVAMATPYDSSLQANGYHPTKSLRPVPVDGLFYDLYPYVGSYYNGTTTFVIEPVDFVPNSTCDTFTNGPVTIVYANSVLGIGQSDQAYWADDLSKAEPLAFMLNFWDNNTDVFSYRNVKTMFDQNDILQRITSFAPHLIPEKVDHSKDDEMIQFHLNSTYNADSSSYSFSGYRNTTFGAQLIHFNHSQCASPESVVFDGGLIQPGHDWAPRKMPNATDYPRVTAQFDNKTVSFEIKATLGTNTASRGNGPQSYLSGEVTIKFEGKLDEARSDELQANPNNGTPIWKPTLGLEKTLNGSKVATSEGTSVRSEWTLGAVLLAGLFIFSNC